MIRKCNILAKSLDGKKAICIDLENKEVILQYIQQSERHKKKWQHIVELILGGHRNTELYDKEEINVKCKNVTAMKFFKGQENDRIYCKEQKTINGVYIVVTSEILLRKKTKNLSKKNISLIEKVGSYEFEIETY